MFNLNLDEYREKVMGCWLGKNIGGTLGTPLEGKRDMQDVKFYLHDMNGDPLPNDDLDLQLVWLRAVEREGIRHITPRVLGEYWLNHIIGPWAEYGVGAANMRNGIMPPLSGHTNNERWHNSNGAWIRSEIWAALFPGSPDRAAHYAWMDASCDHYDEGIYAELFTSALESSAYIENDVHKLIHTALAYVPEKSRVARAVRLVCDAYAKKIDYRDTRNMIVKDSEDLGWFQAPGNVAFTVLGLLYGEGDFEKTICYAVNCGDDTDCTGATAGAVMGIMYGVKNIPEKWVKPIGHAIKTIAVNPFHCLLPATIEELTSRVIYAAQLIAMEDPLLPRITDAPASFTAEDAAKLATPSADVIADLWERPSNMLEFIIPYGTLMAVYESGALAVPGDVLKFRFCMSARVETNAFVTGKWLLPEGWTSSAPGFQLRQVGSETTVEITTGPFTDNVVYLALELHLTGRNDPTLIYLPVQHREGTTFVHQQIPPLLRYYPRWDREQAVMKVITGKK